MPRCCACAISSASRRLLPSPGSPETSATVWPLPEIVSSSPQSRLHSAVRPTSPVVSRRGAGVGAIAGVGIGTGVAATAGVEGAMGAGSAVTASGISPGFSRNLRQVRCRANSASRPSSLNTRMADSKCRSASVWRPSRSRICSRLARAASLNGSIFTSSRACGSAASGRSANAPASVDRMRACRRRRSSRSARHQAWKSGRSGRSTPSRNSPRKAPASSCKSASRNAGKFATRWRMTSRSTSAPRGSNATVSRVATMRGASGSSTRARRRLRLQRSDPRGSSGTFQNMVQSRSRRCGFPVAAR